MVDSRFYPPGKSFSITELAGFLDAEIKQGDGNASINGVSTLLDASQSDIVFYNDAKYKDDMAVTLAGAILTSPRDLEDISDLTAAILLVDNPYKSYALIAQKIFPLQAQTKPVAGVQTEQIHPDAVIGLNVEIGYGAVIGAGAEIGDETIIGANAVIGPGCVIGRRSIIGANSVVQFALIGDEVHIHPNVSIGQDGFGYAPDFSGHVKIPQLGRVIIQSHVSIGVGSDIDRGTLTDTVIGEGTKLDNQVHVAHNVHIGRHCLIAGQVGFAGSSIIEDYVMSGGQVAFNGHIHVGKGARILGASVVVKNIPAGEEVAGYPARSSSHWRKETALLSRLLKKRKTINNE